MRRARSDDGRLKAYKVAFLPYVMWGDLESASKNTSDPILKIRKERFLIFPLACDLVLAFKTTTFPSAPIEATKP